MGPYKAPGDDGFPPVFFQVNWNRVGPGICSFVKQVFGGSMSVRNANKTLITLIPKRDNPEYVQHFRPISLCTVHYKCVTKVITARLKGVMDDLISPFQASFIRGRQIQDNLIVGQEVLHTMKKARGRRGFMALKIDLEKAYDRLSWRFIQQTLIMAGLDRGLINLILDCVSSASYNVLWNGEKTEYFKPGRGIRQGDPISPYLFVLCIDRLSHLICDMVNEGKWVPIKTSRGGPNISHLMFADDLLLFGVASTEQASCMMECLNNFCEASGERVNTAKSSMFFSPRVSREVITQIQSITNMKITAEIGTYLGFPLSRKRKPTATFQYIVERVSAKLATWKANSLSMAGRITLAKSILSSVPLYPMQVAHVPLSICKEVERIQCNFIWGRRYHNVGWETITLPKHLGGLGIKQLAAMNSAFGCKLAWKLMTGEKGLWCDTLLHKYIVRNESEMFEVKAGDSALWKFVCKQKHIVEKGVRWRIRGGRLVKFFTDAWLSNDLFIKDYCLRPLSEAEWESKVADWILANTWDFNRLVTVVSREIIKRLAATHPPVLGAGQDVLMWGASSNGTFSVTTAYNIIVNPDPSLFHPGFKLIWKWSGAERVRVFMWLAFHDRLPTNVWRSRWSISSPLCNFCDGQEESVMHILRDCSYAKEMWYDLLNPTHVAVFFNARLKDWFCLNLKRELGKFSHLKWNTLFAVGIWKLWNWRNMMVFDSSFQKPRFPANVIVQVGPSFSYGGRQSVLFGASEERHGIWSPPPYDWCKINVDGAVTADGSLAGCGGVLRDARGVWLSGFSYHLGICSALEAEEWAFLKGLQFARNKGVDHLVVESDSWELISALSQPADVNGQSLVMAQIRDLLALDWSVQWKHAFREQNQVADRLAKEGLVISSIYDHCPSFLRSLIILDCVGVHSPLAS
ncbi:hypothetical protein QN277_014390 [Acacia crassicarpa]|uniref:Non-LTR retroelement reverse transcriptase n=1 Tax=Acacia crassicarpa TaxID=499986 RepID=A0AAE1IMN7_9FABA|nr:hypothetical protein QN277_014390 [Acacia crassicarpa]